MSFLDNTLFCSWLLVSWLLDLFLGYDTPWEERRVRAWLAVKMASLGSAGRLVLGSMLPLLEPSHGSASPLTALCGCCVLPLSQGVGGSEAQGGWAGGLSGLYLLVEVFCVLPRV